MKAGYCDSASSSGLLAALVHKDGRSRCSWEQSSDDCRYSSSLFHREKMYMVLGNLGTSPNLHIVAHSYHKVLYKAVGSYSSVFLRDSFQIQSSVHRDILQSSWLVRGCNLLLPGSFIQEVRPCWRKYSTWRHGMG